MDCLSCAGGEGNPPFFPGPPCRLVTLRPLFAPLLGRASQGAEESGGVSVASAGRGSGLLVLTLTAYVWRSTVSSELVRTRGIRLSN